MKVQTWPNVVYWPTIECLGMIRAAAGPWVDLIKRNLQLEISIDRFAMRLPNMRNFNVGKSLWHFSTAVFMTLSLIPSEEILFLYY